MNEQTVDTLIVGAGIAGISAARVLTARHPEREIMILDKGRGVGGRVASRRFRGLRYDTGAQFFTAYSDSFRAAVAEAHAAGAVVPWYERARTPASETSGTPGAEQAASDQPPLIVWRGTTGMTDLPKFLVSRLPVTASVRLSTRITGIEDRGAGESLRYRVTAIPDSGEPIAVDASRVIVTAPVEQALALLGDLAPAAIRSALGDLAYNPCLALLVDPADDGWIAPGAPGIRRVRDGLIDVITDNGAKGLTHPDPARTGASALTIHFDGAVSAELYDHSDDEILRHLTERLAAWPGGGGARARSETDAAPRDHADPDASRWREAILRAREEERIQLKKWKFAQPQRSWPDRTVLVAPNLALAGDMFGGARVEGAWLSGEAAARAIDDARATEPASTGG